MRVTGFRPTRKIKDVCDFIDDTSNGLFGRKRTVSIEHGECVCCGKEVRGFKDSLSEQEYRISGFCSDCQDGVFN